MRDVEDMDFRYSGINSRQPPKKIHIDAACGPAPGTGKGGYFLRQPFRGWSAARSQQTAPGHDDGHKLSASPKVDETGSTNVA